MINELPQAQNGQVSLKTPGDPAMGKVIDVVCYALPLGTQPVPHSEYQSKSYLYY
jgi:hypothetical protein